MKHEFPTGYEAYRVAHKDDTSSQHRNLVKFGERYRLAGQLESVSIHGYSSKTLMIYTAALRVALTYSAFEQLSSIPRLSGLASVRLPAAAVAFRSKTFDKFRVFVLSNSGPRLSKNLKTLSESSGDSNVLPIIEAIRHAMFHGSLTPGSIGFDSARGFQFLESLSQGLFKEMDRLFQLVVAEDL